MKKGGLRYTLDVIAPLFNSIDGLGNVFSAMRGPDDHKGKGQTCTKIRFAAFGGHFPGTNHPTGKVSQADLDACGSSHFRGHMQSAAASLGILVP